MIEVTKVELKLSSTSNGMKALCHIVLNDMFAVHDIRVVESARGNLVVAMPSKKLPSGSFRDICNPVNGKARKIINDAVLEEYKKATTLDKEVAAILS
jgi:stage V sporulation protein G